MHTANIVYTVNLLFCLQKTLYECRGRIGQTQETD